METLFLDEALQREKIRFIGLDERVDEMFDAFLDEYCERHHQIHGVTLNGGPVFEEDFE